MKKWLHNAVQYVWEGFGGKRQTVLEVGGLDQLLHQWLLGMQYGRLRR